MKLVVGLRWSSSILARPTGLHVDAWSIRVAELLNRRWYASVGARVQGDRWVVLEGGGVVGVLANWGRRSVEVDFWVVC